MAELITAWRVADNVQVTIPSDWIGDPVLGVPFTADRPETVSHDCCGADVDDEEDTAPETADASASEETTTTGTTARKGK